MVYFVLGFLIGVLVGMGMLIALVFSSQDKLK